MAMNREREKWGKKPVGLGSTELGRLVTGWSGVLNGATFQLPTFGHHSNREATSFVAVSKLPKVLGQVLAADTSS